MVMAEHERELAEGRTAVKRRQITEAAFALFLRNGYSKTSMEQIATDAGVSKQTVYKQFADKETLFQAIARGVTTNSNAIIEQLETVISLPVRTTEDLRRLLEQLARLYLEAVLSPHVLSLRRLLISEADQFPELAHEYYQWGPARGMEMIESALQRWAAQELVAVPGRTIAASQFAYLALAAWQDHSLFHPGQVPTSAEIDETARAAASTFLAAYGRTANH